MAGKSASLILFENQNYANKAVFISDTHKGIWYNRNFIGQRMPYGLYSTWASLSI